MSRVPALLLTTAIVSLAHSAAARAADPATMQVNLGSTSFQAAEAITAGVVGAGVNGPAHAQVGMSVNMIKNGWWLKPGAPGGPAVGEMDGFYSTTTQGGAGSDTSAYLGQVTATGLGFANVLEGNIRLQSPITSGNGVTFAQLDVQAGIINVGQQVYGFAASLGLKPAGGSAIGYYLSGSGWDHLLQLNNGSADAFDVDGSGDLGAAGTVAGKAFSGAGDALTVVVNGQKQGLGPWLTAIEKQLASTGGAPVVPASGTSPAAFADPAGGQTQFGFHANTHELAVWNSAANANTLAVENDDPAGFAAATFRGPDLAYGTGSFEHGALGWAPRCNLRGGVGCDYLEVSRYDGRQDAHELPPPFALIQTGGEFTAPPTPVVLSITAGSTSATLRQGTLSAAAKGQSVTSVEYPNYLGEGAVIVDVKGSTVTLSKPSVMTNGWVPSEYGPTAYGQYNTVELTETGPINVYRFVDSNGGAMHDPFLVLDRVFGTVRVGAVPVAAQAGGYTIGKGDCGTVIRDTGSAAHVYTVQAGLPVGCEVHIVAAGIGPVVFAGGAGVTVEQMGAGTLAHQTAGQFARADILVDSASTFLLSGQVQ